MTLLELPGLREEMLLVERYLNKFLAPEQEKGCVAEIIRAVTATSGKRYRPRLVLLTGRLGPDYPACRERLCKLGALVEMVHMASLIHDDIVDDSPLRRGCQTIQSRFGKDMAVYTGDLILGRVMRILFQEGMAQSGVLLARTIEDMCQGEIGQFHCRYRIDTTVEDYLDNIYGKTVSMFVTACRIGGGESGCSENILHTLSSLGEQLGYLFQVRDDLLDFLSDARREGKPVHMDFWEGVFTLPILHTLAHPDYGPKIQAFVELAKAGLLTERDLQELNGLIRAAGGLDATAEFMDDRVQMAWRALDALPAGPSKLALSEILEKMHINDSVFAIASAVNRCG